MHNEELVRSDMICTECSMCTDVTTPYMQNTYPTDKSFSNCRVFETMILLVVQYFKFVTLQ